MKTYLVANWKSNKTPSEAESWFQTVKKSLPKLNHNLEIILCAPFIHLELIRRELPKLSLGVQNLSPYPDGAYTGEISARMLQGLASYCLLGHSERRHYFHETSPEIALKVRQALEYDLTPIIAVSQANWRDQLNQLTAEEISHCLIMYEPPEAISKQVGPIGEGEAAPIAEVISAIEKIKQSAPRSPVLYGGSIKSHNIQAFLSNPIIDGVVPGSASLNAEEWLKLIDIAQKIRG